MSMLPIPMEVCAGLFHPRAVSLGRWEYCLMATWSSAEAVASRPVAGGWFNPVDFLHRDTLLAGPSVGPDGNVYAADDSRWSQDVIGAFILSPEGQLLWSGGKYYRRGGGWTPQEIKFGGGNAYFWSDYSSTGDPEVLGGLNALHLGGGLFWRVEDGVGILPDSNPNGDVVLFRPSNIEMHNASNATIWSKDLNIFGGQPQVEAVLASDGRTYFTTTTAKLHAISPTGEILYSKLIGGIVSNHIVRPDANQIALQYQPNFGIPAQIQGYDKGANLLWSQELPIEFGMTIVCYNLMEYDATGNYALLRHGGALHFDLRGAIVPLRAGCTVAQAVSKSSLATTGTRRSAAEPEA